MSENWLEKLQLEMRKRMAELKKRGIEVREERTEDGLVYRIDTESLIKVLRKEVREKLESVMRLAPAEFKIRKTKGVEMAVVIARGDLTEQDRQKLEILQAQYKDGFQWAYNSKNKTLRVVLVLNKFYEIGIEELLKKVTQQLAEASSLMAVAGVSLNYEVEVGKEVLIKIQLS